MWHLNCEVLDNVMVHEKSFLLDEVQQFCLWLV